ncbi:MAG: alanine dehydrogenase [Gemmatimonadales bacterium]|nr:alanine dehydrogenase [Gemmatimonadales bacterium]
MIIGIPRTRSLDEFRVGLPPRAVRNLTAAGSEVIVERKAGHGAGFSDQMYQESGARVVHDLAEVYGRADVIVMVNKPVPEEYPFITEDQVLMSVMNLAVGDPALISLLRERNCTAIDFVTIQEESGSLPVLRPLSQIAGRMVPQIASKYLQTDHGGLGILLGGAPAVPPAEVVVIGAGTVGRNAVRACVGAGARVTLLDSDYGRISEIDWTFPGQVTTFKANEAALRKVLGYADVVVGAVLIPGTRTPHLVTKEMIGLLREKSLIIDISIDQGGCFETSRPTRLSDPSYVVDGITHYCVPNLTSLVARSASYALCNATLPYVCSVVEQPLKQALANDPALAHGVNIMGGQVTHPGLAANMGIDPVPVADLLTGGTS